MTKVIACFQNKGGSMKTTLAVNLSVMLAKDNYRVLLIDLDAQSNVSMTFGKNPFQIENSSYDLIMDNGYQKEDLYKPMENLDVIFSNKDLNYLDLDVYSNLKEYPAPFSLLSKQLEALKPKYDFVIFDTPPSFNLASLNGLAASDYVLIPSIPEAYSVQGIMSILETIDMIEENQNHSLEILGFVNVLVSDRTNLHKDIMEQTHLFAQSRGLKVFNTYISRSINTASTVLSDEKPIMMMNQNNKTTQEYKELYAEIIEELKKVGIKHG